MEFIAVDLETTGFSHEKNTILEIAGVHVKDFKHVGEYHTIIDIGRKLTPRQMAMSGITNNDIPLGKPIRQALIEFYGFAKHRDIVAHNAPFDKRFIEANTLRQFNNYVSNRWFCTLKMSRRLHPELDSHKLGDMLEHYGYLMPRKHRALPDAKACADLFLILHGKKPIYHEHKNKILPSWIDIMK